MIKLLLNSLATLIMMVLVIAVILAAGAAFCYVAGALAHPFVKAFMAGYHCSPL